MTKSFKDMNLEELIEFISKYTLQIREADVELQNRIFLLSQNKRRIKND